MSVGLSRPSDLRRLIYRGLYFSIAQPGSNGAAWAELSSKLNLVFVHFPVPLLASQPQCSAFLRPIPAPGRARPEPVRCRVRVRVRHVAFAVPLFSYASRAARGKR